jgi:hypothetical protein
MRIWFGIIWGGGGVHGPPQRDRNNARVLARIGVYPEMAEIWLNVQWKWKLLNVYHTGSPNGSRFGGIYNPLSAVLGTQFPVFQAKIVTLGYKQLRPSWSTISSHWSNLRLWIWLSFFYQYQSSVSYSSSNSKMLASRNCERHVSWFYDFMFLEKALFSATLTFDGCVCSSLISRGRVVSIHHGLLLREVKLGAFLH